MRAKADSVLRLLELRKLKLSEAQRARILQCNDDDLLQRWFDRAVTAPHIDEVFLG